MTRIPTVAAAVVAALLAAAVPVAAGEPGHVDGPADWAAGAPGPDHAARAYPQYAQQESVSPITFMGVTALGQRLRSGDSPIIIDVRTYREYLEAHLPGAVSIPLDEIEMRLAEIPRRGMVVLY